MQIPRSRPKSLLRENAIFTRFAKRNRIVRHGFLLEREYSFFGGRTSACRSDRRGGQAHRPNECNLLTTVRDCHVRLNINCFNVPTYPYQSFGPSIPKFFLLRDSSIKSFRTLYRCEPGKQTRTVRRDNVHIIKDLLFRYTNTKKLNCTLQRKPEGICIYIDFV